MTAYLRMFIRFGRRKLWVSLALMILLGFTQGIGLLMLVPLLRIIGVGDSGEGGGQEFSFIRDFFHETGIPLTLPVVMALYFLLVVVQASATYYQSVLNSQLINGFTLFLRTRFIRALTYGKWMSFVRTKSSDYVHVLTSEISRVAGTTQMVLTLPGYILVACVQVGVAFSISPAMTSAALLCGAILFALMLPFNRKIQKSGQALRDSTNAMYSSITDFLAGMKVAKSFGLEETHLAIFQQNSTEIARQLVSFTRIISRSGMYFQIGTAAAVGTFLWGAVELVQLPPDRLLVVVFIFTRLLPRFRSLQHSYHQILHALPSFRAASWMQQQLELDREPEAGADVTGMPLEKALSLENVSFTYDPDLDSSTLREVDLKIPAGCMTAILGPSGAGKTTLADLVMGLLEPDAGQVLIDGRPLTQDHLHSWRSSVGYVPQENFLFHETIRTNLQWAKPDATELEMQQALESAAALDFVTALPEGLDTLVGDRGVRLSGGERQRIALARALLRRPTLLLLDEATSSLDTRNEEKIQEAVERLHGEITIVIIAHRMSTVRRADHVIIMDGGEVAETGSWSDLIQVPGGRLRALSDG